MKRNGMQNRKIAKQRKFQIEFNCRIGVIESIVIWKFCDKKNKSLENIPEIYAAIIHFKGK